MKSLLLLFFLPALVLAQESYKPHGVFRDSMKVTRVDTVGTSFKRDSVYVAKVSQPGWLSISLQNLSTTDTLRCHFCNAWADTQKAPLVALAPSATFQQGYREVSWVRWITCATNAAAGQRRILIVQ